MAIDAGQTQVKALEWGQTSYGKPEAATVAGVYRITDAWDGGFNLTRGQVTFTADDGRKNFPTIDAAKAAAQSDFDARILSAIIPASPSEATQSHTAFDDIVAAYLRGASWAEENGSNEGYLRKAAYDYADKITGSYPSPPAVKALTVDEIRPTDDITARLDNLAQQIAADGEYPPHTLTDLAEAASKITTLRKALGEMLHAVCHETGFANAVREDSGISYPWPALDIAEANARAALAQGGGQ